MLILHILARTATLDFRHGIRIAMNRNLLFSLLLIVASLILCLGTGLLSGLAVMVPRQAEKAFGPPSKQLTRLQHILLSAQLLLDQDDLNQPLDPQGVERDFEIQLGESTYRITGRLQSEGFIPDSASLRNYLVYTGLDTTLQAGKFELSPGMTPVEIAGALQDATPNEVTFLILPGWRMEEIAASLPTSGLSITPQAFLSGVSSPPPGTPLAAELPPGATLEGFLYPDTYRLPRGTTLEELIATLLSDFQIKVDQELKDGFARQGLSLFQAVTLASIIEREAIVEDEMPLIASVFLNRLSAGMKLDSDPTVQYALGYDAVQDTWWINPLTLEHLQFDSPYNTYLYPGLPPGPIANPGLNAMRAVAFPAQTPYLYFRAACDNSGRHTFSMTFEEHQNNACP
jgi:UPF0755 protein